MDRWQNKVAVVTGASSGIGAATAADLVKAGFIVAALARRLDRLEQNKLALPADQRSRYYHIKCDVRDENDVKKAFEWIEKNLGGTDVLINNAGIARGGKQISDPNCTSDMRDVIETNVMSVVYCVREAFNSMKKRNFDGHVVIINSILGHTVPCVPGRNFNIYPASKYAVTAMVETYRQEFSNAGTKVKISSVSPGAVETEIFSDPAAFRASGNPLLNAEDISNAVLYILSTPPHVQIHEMIIKPVGEKI